MSAAPPQCRAPARHLSWTAASPPAPTPVCSQPFMQFQGRCAHPTDEEEASDALVTATAAAALAVLTSAQSTGGLEYCGPQYEFGFAGSQGTAIMSGESIR